MDQSDILPPVEKKNRLVQGIGYLISVLCLVFIFYKVEFRQLLAALEQFRWMWIPVSVLSLAAGYLLRIKRWAMMLGLAGKSVKAVKCAAPFLGSITLNNVLPFRAGDIIRAFIFPTSLGVTKTASLASLILERLADLFTLVVLLMGALYIVDLPSVPAWMTDTVLVLSILIALAIAVLIVFNRQIDNIFQLVLVKVKGKISPRGVNALESLLTLFRTIGVMAQKKALPKIIGISFALWLLEAGFFGGMIYGTGLAVTPAIAMLLMAMTTLSTLVPSSPGYVGPFHLAAFSGIMLIGGTEAQASCFALLTHFLLWALTTIAGGIAFAMHPDLLTRKQK